jgi:hypothetical protein
MKQSLDFFLLSQFVSCSFGTCALLRGLVCLLLRVPVLGLLAARRRRSVLVLTALLLVLLGLLLAFLFLLFLVLFLLLVAFLLVLFLRLVRVAGFVLFLAFLFLLSKTRLVEDKD